MTLILIASVGGSPQPIASAISAKRPDRVLFLATASRGNQPGSAEEIPTILEKAQRPQLAHEMLCLDDPDDPEAAFLALRDAIDRLRAAHPKAEFLFDYTGGTKSMTAAVFQCAVATAGSAVQFMGGRRDNLNTVTPGSERPVRIAIEWLIAERQEARLREAWRGFDYATAAQGFRRLHADLGSDEKAPEIFRQRLADLAALSECFDLWDRFRHADAAAGLEALAGRRPGLKPLLVQAKAAAERQPARILDLWRNAERCAARGRYDDAIARLYRFVEWIAQWRLHAKHGLKTSNMDWGRISSTVIDRAGLEQQQGKRTLSGCVQAWKLVAALEPGRVVDRFLTERFPHKDPKKTGEGRLRDMLDRRNHSILAHGERPLDEADWRGWHEFADSMRQNVLSSLLREADEAVELPPQLPQDPAELGL